MKTLLSIMVGIVALVALVSGMLLMIHPDGTSLNLPLYLLDTTPFSNYFVPGLILFFLVGGTHCAALILNIRNKPGRYNWSIFSGLVLSGWIFLQINMIHTANWLHISFLVLGILIVLLGYQMKGRWVV
jgi:hypothetical protein